MLSATQEVPGLKLAVCVNLGSIVQHDTKVSTEHIPCCPHETSCSAHCQWKTRGLRDASPGCSSACWRARCPGDGWLEPRPGNIVMKKVLDTQAWPLSHIFSILLGWAVDDGETAADEVILHIHDYKGWLWLHYLQHHASYYTTWPAQACLSNPPIPEVDELLHTHAPVPGHVEDHEQVSHLLQVKPGN